MASNPRELIEFCQSLLRLPSLPGDEGAVAAAVAAQMNRLGYDQVEVDEYGNVIGQIWGKESGPTLFFDAHMDVVPVTNPDDWQHAPWSGELQDGRLWGRGSADTKGSLAAMLFAAGWLPRHELHGRCIVVASVGEEYLTGAALGPVIDRFSPQVFVTGEPTNLKLGVAQKGRVSLLLSAHGRSAHTSRPELGDNAVYKMMDAITCLRALPRSIDPQLGSTVLELTEIASEPRPGTSFVPHFCQARLIGRILPGETRQGILVHLDQAFEGLPGVEIQFAPLRQDCYTGAVLEMEDFLPGWCNAPDNKWQARILTGFESTGLPVETFGAPFGTNASAAAARGVTSFIYGPGSLEQAHTVDEWLAVDELIKAAEGYTAMALACLRGK